MKTTLNPSLGLAGFRRRVVAAVAPTRIWDWWEFKTPTLLGVAYLCAAACGVPAERTWEVLGLVIAALVPVASYVCVINDLTDMEVDRRAGKFNSMAGLPRTARAGWLVGCLAAGIAAGLALATCSRMAATLYAANWLAFTLYSVPPIRLKSRGAWGIVADACGGQLLPVLWTAVLVTEAGEAAAPQGMIPLLATWALALGVRAIMSHQAADASPDRAAGAATLGARLGADRLEAIGRRWVLPVELAALAGGLVVAGSAPTIALAAGFLAGQWLLCRIANRPLNVVARQPGGWLVLFRYYVTVFPLGFLPQLALPTFACCLIAACHVAAFPGSWGLSLAALLRPHSHSGTREAGVA